MRMRQQRLESETLQELRSYMAMQQEEQVEMWKMLREMRQENAALVMLRLMKGMQEMQRQMMDTKRREGTEEEDKGIEWVRGGTQQELPRLTEWSASSGPIYLNDWLHLLEPQMSDLTAMSAEWRKRLLGEARQWYEEHQRLPPLSRMDQAVRPSDDLSQRKWHRLERRASTLLLTALPETA